MRSSIMIYQGIGDAMAGIITVVWFLYVSKYWVTFELVIAVTVIPIVIGFMWLPESPEFYYSKGRFQECEQVILRIAKFNGVEMGADTL